MQRLIVGLLVISVLVTSCVPQEPVITVPEQAGPSIEPTFTALPDESEDVITVGGETLLVKPVVDDSAVSGIQVSALDVGAAILIEYRDPSGRFLPSVQMVRKSDGTAPQEVIVDLKPVELGWVVSNLGEVETDNLVGDLVDGAISWDQVKELLNEIANNEGGVVLISPERTLQDEGAVLDLFSVPGTRSTYFAMRSQTGLAKAPGLAVPAELIVALVAIGILVIWGTLSYVGSNEAIYGDRNSCDEIGASALENGGNAIVIERQHLGPSYLQMVFTSGSRPPVFDGDVVHLEEGPACNDYSWWWKVTTEDDKGGWLPEHRDGSLILKPSATETALSGLTPEAASPTTTGPITYVVAEGDSLASIADQFGVTMDKLIAANNLVDPNNIGVGTQLIIPE